MHRIQSVRFIEFKPSTTNRTAWEIPEGLDPFSGQMHIVYLVQTGTTGNTTQTEASQNSLFAIPESASRHHSVS
jgi:hypothetical protein